MSNLSLEVLIYRNLGFRIKPSEREWRENVWEKRNGGKIELKARSANFYPGLFEHVNEMFGRAEKCNFLLRSSGHSLNLEHTD
jgi:hypothetical protein